MSKDEAIAKLKEAIAESKRRGYVLITLPRAVLEAMLNDLHDRHDPNEFVAMKDDRPTLFDWPNMRPGGI